jgi:hypothetical protein
VGTRINRATEVHAMAFPATLNRRHASAHLRDAFLEAAELRDTDQLRRLAGMLWNCTDILPGTAAEYDFGLPAGSTYAQAPRQVRRTA